MIDLKAIGARIESARKEAGYTQSDLGDILGMSQPNLSRIENGASKLTLGHLMTLQEVLGRPVDYFLGYESNLPEDEERLLAVYRRLPENGPLRRTAYHSLAALVLSLLELPNQGHGSPVQAESKTHSP